MDFMLYGITVVVLAAYLLVGSQHEQRVEPPSSMSCTASCHHLHEEHHQRPTVVIFTPTILSVTYRI